MDRKREFAERVNAINRAHLDRRNELLWPASAALREEVAALRRRLLSGDKTAISESLDLLEIRKPVFGVGYEQEKLARPLKKAPLDESDLGRVELLVLKLIESELKGGQLRELVRVLANGSTSGFRESLVKLSASDNVVVRRRAVRTLSVVTQRGRRPTTRCS